MMIPSRTAAVSALLIFGATVSVAIPAARAQTPPAPATAQPAPASPATTTPPAVPALPQPEISPEKLAIARDVVRASGMSRSFEPMVPQLEEQIPVVITRTRPELAKDLTGVLAQLQPEFDKKGAEMIDIAAKIYARRMSDADLKATAAFFDSPAGKRYVEAQPVMLDELVVAMQAWTQETSNFMMKRVQTEMEKKGDKF